MPLQSTYRAPGAQHYLRPSGAWDVPTLDNLLTNAIRGADTCVVDESRRVDGRQLEDLVARMAGVLRRRGVRRGDLVAWQLPNCLESMVLFRACWRCGAIAVPIHDRAGEQEINHYLEILEPTVLLSSLTHPMMERPGVLQVTVGTADIPFGDLLDSEHVRTSPNVPSDTAVVLFTSGSTGRAKAVLHTHRGLAYKAITMRGVHGLGANDVLLTPIPLAHMGGLLNAVVVAPVARFPTVIMDRWDPERALRWIEAEQVSFMVGPPPLFNSLFELSGFDRRKVQSIRVVSTGMMGVSPEFVRSAQDTLDAIVKRSYGSTEAPTMSTCLNTDSPERWRNTDGRAVGEAEIQIVNPISERPCAPSEAGEIWVRGPELFAGYADPDDTAAVVTRGWFRTGDLGTLDSEGWLQVTGRLKEVIIRAGENIAPAEVEQALATHPSIIDVAVIGFPDDRLGERVAAFVTARERFDLDQGRLWLDSVGISRFKMPELIVQMDRLPVLNSGKVDRTDLRARAITAARVRFGHSGSSRP